MTDASGPDARVAASVAGRERWQSAVIAAIVPLTPAVVSVRLRPQHTRPFLAGQHVDVRLTAEDGYRAQRSYSVASAPDEGDTIELVIERLDDGEVSTYFHDSAAPGDTVEIAGPHASYFVWRPGVDGSVLLAAGGSGVAPFLSMVRQRARLADPTPMLLLYSARTWGDVIARDELLAHERRQSGFTACFCLTRDVTRRSSDFARRVDQAVIDAMLARLGGTPTHTFVCGANTFVGAIADFLLAAGVPAGSVRTERYGGD